MTSQEPTAGLYWDRIAEETRKENHEISKEQALCRNYVAEYADEKSKDLLLKVFERFVSLHGKCTILDVGCGLGKWTRIFAEKGYRTIGIDASARMTELAKERTNGKSAGKVGFFNMDASMLGFRTATFDFINCVTVLQHILTNEKWRYAIKEMVRVTKPNGYMLLYEAAPLFALQRKTENLRFRTLKEYEAMFAEAGAQLVFSLATDVSFPLTVFGLRRYSTTFSQSDAYFYRAKRRKAMSIAQVSSMISRILAKVAREIDYTLAETPLGSLSPFRILLFKRTDGASKYPRGAYSSTI